MHNIKCQIRVPEMSYDRNDPAVRKFLKGKAGKKQQQPPSVQGHLSPNHILLTSTRGARDLKLYDAGTPSSLSPIWDLI